MIALEHSLADIIWLLSRTFGCNDTVLRSHNTYQSFFTAPRYPYSHISDFNIHRIIVSQPIQRINYPKTLCLAFSARHCMFHKQVVNLYLLVRQTLQFDHNSKRHA